MNACASCAISGVAVRPVPIAQTGSYASTRSVVRLEQRRAWRLEDVLRLPGLALLVRLADARDHAQARFERRFGARAATVSSVSPKYWRRSEWPTSEPATPSSSSIGAEISPVYAPSCSQWTFCAYVVRPASTQSRGG